MSEDERKGRSMSSACTIMKKLFCRKQMFLGPMNLWFFFLAHSKSKESHQIAGDWQLLLCCVPSRLVPSFMSTKLNSKGSCIWKSHPGNMVNMKALLKILKLFTKLSSKIEKTSNPDFIGNLRTRRICLHLLLSLTHLVSSSAS